MKKLLKKFAPKFLLLLWGKIRMFNVVRKGFQYDFKRYMRYSTNHYEEEGRIARIVMASHGIEKGLTMPNFRYAFGQDKLDTLISLIEDYHKIFGKENAQIMDAVEVILEYRKCHQDANKWGEVNLKLQQRIDSLATTFAEVEAKDIQISMSDESYFGAINSAFPEFAKSRHSIRNFSKEPIPMADMQAAVDLARTAPSGCNRQPTRLIIIDDKEKIKAALSLQTGNSGFGDTVDKLILVCGYIGGYNSVQERNWVYIDTGIFIMNLVYSLHYYKIGSCILNWTTIPQQDRELRELLAINPAYNNILFIACGKPPKEFKVCSSARKTTKQISRTI